MKKTPGNTGPGRGNPDEDHSSRYIRIPVPITTPLSGKEQEQVLGIGKRFNRKDCFFETQGNTLDFFLHSLDYNLFESALSDWLETEGEDTTGFPNLVKAFPFLLKKVNRIRSYGIRGKKRVYVGYTDERKVRNRQEKVQKRGSYYYTAGHGFDAGQNNVPPEFCNTIITGDSRVVLSQMPPNCVDLVITSPPYNFGLGYDLTEDGVDWERYFETLFAVFDECIRVLKYGGRIIVNIQPLFSDYIPSHHIISRYFMDQKLIWKGEILWEKNNYNCKYTAWGSWKSPSNPYLKYTWEFLEIFAKGDLKKEGQKENIDISGDEFKNWVVAKWPVAPERRMDTYDHPAMFPEELVERALKLFSYRGDFILDPFNGAGTTCVVAKRTGRQYLGIDISEKYCTVARKRLEELC